MTNIKLGFVGLGQMGQPMAANIAATQSIFVHDKIGTLGRVPTGATGVEDLVDVVTAADTIFLSVPDGAVSIEILNSLSHMSDRRVKTIIDLSTTGIEASREAGQIAADMGIN